MKLVIFDFCETLVNFQTADAFIDYIIEKEGYRKYHWIHKLDIFLTKNKLISLINKIAPEYNPSKRIKLYQIKNLEKEKVEKYAYLFFENKIKTNLIEPLYELFLSHIDNKDHVLIISGGYSPYIKLFAETHKINGFFATELAFSSKKFTGFFKGKDCLFKQKVVLLKKYLESNKINYTSSVAYSDSITDLPLLCWVDEPVVISKNKSQLWAVKYGFKEIIHN